MTRFLFFSLAFLLAVAPLAAQKKISDDSIIDQVRIKLAADADVGGMAINVESHDGMVILKGKVRTEKQRAKAEKIARKVKGVTGVTNQLVVSPD
jgi:osmotically-inducible protein OsmY